jgi:uncharacterized protein YpmB
MKKLLILLILSIFVSSCVIVDKTKSTACKPKHKAQDKAIRKSTNANYMARKTTTYRYKR